MSELSYGKCVLKNKIEWYAMHTFKTHQYNEEVKSEECQG